MSINGMTVLGITLARGESKGIKDKNMKLLAGKPVFDFFKSKD